MCGSRWLATAQQFPHGMRLEATEKGSFEVRKQLLLRQKCPRLFVINSGPVLVPWNLHSSHFLPEILYKWRSQCTLESLAGFSSQTHHELTKWTDGMLLSVMFYRSNGKPLPSLQRTISEVGEKKQINWHYGRHTCLFMMGSGKGLQHALWIARSAIFRTLVSKQTILNFAWSVNAIDTFQRQNMKIWKKLTLHHLAVSWQSNQKDIVERKSNLIYRPFD